MTWWRFEADQQIEKEESLERTFVRLILLFLFWKHNSDVYDSKKLDSARETHNNNIVKRVN